MKVRFVCPYWGLEGLEAALFLEKAVNAGYDGVEVNVPPGTSSLFGSDLLRALRALRRTDPDFLFIAQVVLPPARESVEAHLCRFRDRLCEVARLKPDWINAHTGKDYYSFEENARFIEACIYISTDTGIPVRHETHRGRFSFHAASLLPYLERFPGLELVGDLSHWCTVSESLLEDQQEILHKVFPRIRHLHARLGHSQGPQVNDPFAPEWEAHLERFIGWWDVILCDREKAGQELFSICPEFGPPPYMPTLPFTCQPIGRQWDINLRLKDLLRERYALFDRKTNPISVQL